MTPQWSQLPEWQGRKLIVAVPSFGAIEADTTFALLALQARHQNKIGFDLQRGNPIGRARNILATRFLNSGADWHFMLDADMLPPVGIRQLYTSVWGGPQDGPFADMDILSRLLSHKKPFIGATYCGKGDTGRAQFAEAYQSEAVNRLAHSGPIDKIDPTAWVAGGANLIHRNVYEAIAKNQPELCPTKTRSIYKFFAMEDWEGEDVLFCQRARAAGIQPWVDYGCPCGHLGTHAYWLHNTQVAENPEAKKL